MVEGVAQASISSTADSWTGRSFEVGIVSKSPRLIFLGRATGESTWDLHWKVLHFFFRISVFNNSKEAFKCNYLGQEGQFSLNGRGPTPSYHIGLRGYSCSVQNSWGGICRPKKFFCLFHIALLMLMQ